jgi:UPF0716 protein FxsA
VSAQPGATPYARGPRRRPRFLRWLFVALLIVPVIEVAAIIAVGKVIGGWPTIGLLILMSIVGTWVLKREGTRTWRALSTALRTGQMPSTEIADAALVLVGGTFLLLPGFLTDIVGFLLILPVTRPLFRGLLAAAVAKRLLSDAGPGPRGPSDGPTVIEGEIVD